MSVEDAGQLFQHYRELQRYVLWHESDGAAVRRAWALVAPQCGQLIDDFYDEIQRHPHTAAVITGGSAQIARLKQTLRDWLVGLFSGTYDEAFVRTRWNVGRRHVAIGLEQAYVSAAVSRLRGGLIETIRRSWTAGADELARSERALHKVLDLELSIIEMAYQQHFTWKLEEEARKQTQQTERLAAIGQMVAGLAHESRNLLQRSHACLETLQLDLGDRPDALKQTRRIQTALDQLHRLYEEVRNYAAPIKLDLADVDLGRLVQSSWQQLEAKWIGREPEFEIRCCHGGVCPVRGDPHRLEQVFTNLFQNALDACAARPKILCSIVRSPSDNYWRISVADNGSGIAADVAQRVFDPFFTTKTQGTGLGLAISRRIVEAHGGTIAVARSDLGGAEIRLELPAHTPSSSYVN
jgi:signal transduction histidine kinase